MLPVIHLSYDEGLDWLEAGAYGTVLDRQGHDRWRGVSEDFGYFLDAPGGREVGFKVKGFSCFDADAAAVAEIFTGPRFAAPMLGLSDVSAGEAVLAARPFLEGGSTLDRLYFNAAIDADGREALALWRAALQAGNQMAHYGAGYTLLDLGEHHAAYRHLRTYTELVACDPWAWCYRARAAVALGERREARECCWRALELSEQTGEETDADELLAELSHDA